MLVAVPDRDERTSSALTYSMVKAQAAATSESFMAETEPNDNIDCKVKCLLSNESEMAEHKHWIPQGEILQDWKTEGICSMAFPTLFPDRQLPTGEGVWDAFSQAG